jgi:hypothetical protein
MKTMKLTIAILIFSTVSAFAQKYEYTQLTTIESVIPGGLGRSRMVTTKPNGELDEVKMEKKSLDSLIYKVGKLAADEQVKFG